jgi:hypothetical protein
MVNNKVKTKAEMLLELESIKGLLLEEDDIPLLQESIFQDSVFQDSFLQENIPQEVEPAPIEQQDFFNPPIAENTISTAARTAPIKATGENPFLPAHIRTRLHGNNPPPLFEIETAKKISSVSRPTTLLGNTQHYSYTAKPSTHQQELIDEVVEAMLPKITHELRERLEGMSKEMLKILLAENK